MKTKFEADIFSKFDKEWALLSAGNKEDHNSMTIAWGGMGTLWGKPVVTVCGQRSGLSDHPEPSGAYPCLTYNS